MDDCTALEANVFFRLACRLPAYRGVLRAHLQAQAAEKDGTPRNAARRAQGNAEKRVNSARAADAAPPATAASLTALNAQLGQTWFAHRVVSPDGEPRTDLRVSAQREYPELRPQ